MKLDIDSKPCEAKSVAVECSISVVSHGQGALVLAMLDSLVESGLLLVGVMEVLITLNVPDETLDVIIPNRVWPFAVYVHKNNAPVGFGANHNRAFSRAKGRWFVVLNPDIVWTKAASAALVKYAFDNEGSRPALFVPHQIDTSGRAQDHMRALLTPWGVMLRAAQRVLNRPQLSGVFTQAEDADWVNGACMVFRSDAFRSLAGFDERFHMYCEDAEICFRLKLAGFQIATLEYYVVHDAQRKTQRDIRHLIWHVSSLLRLWSSSVFWHYWWAKKTNRLPRSEQANCCVTE